MKSKVLTKNLGTDDYSVIVGENGQWTNLVKRENLLTWTKEQPVVKDESGQSTLNSTSELLGIELERAADIAAKGSGWKFFKNLARHIITKEQIPKGLNKWL